MLPASLGMIHDARRSRHNDETELTKRQELNDPLLEIVELRVIPGANDTALVQTTFCVRVRDPRAKRVTRRPRSWTTILPLRWSTISSNSLMYPDTVNTHAQSLRRRICDAFTLQWRCMMARYLMTTLELERRWSVDRFFRVARCKR
jgi:hypothetical protein